MIKKTKTALRQDHHKIKALLDTVHDQYNQKELIEPDPLQFLHGYPDPLEREVVGLLAALLAYGRVEQIIKAVKTTLMIMQHRPLSYLQETDPATITHAFAPFKYRFTKGADMSFLLIKIQNAIRKYGALHHLFVSGITPEDIEQCNILPPMTRFFENILEGGQCGHLLPNPAKGSACKRMNLFLRWMVRHDGVDPGGWDQISPAMLIIPLDTHMHHIGRILGFTRRGQANMKTALEITAGFRTIAPEDPVKYDFSLTRFGIRKEMNLTDFEKMVSHLH